MPRKKIKMRKLTLFCKSLFLWTISGNDHNTTCFVNRFKTLPKNNFKTLKINLKVSLYQSNRAINKLRFSLMRVIKTLKYRRGTYSIDRRLLHSRWVARTFISSLLLKKGRQVQYRIQKSSVFIFNQGSTVVKPMAVS